MPQPLPTVLIVDDNKEFCASLSDCFEHRGFSVNASIDAVTAMYLNQSREYDVVAVDLNLPAMSGLTLFRRMRRVCPDLRGVLITGALNPETDAEARQAGFSAVLAKPIDFPQLEQMILDACDRMSRPEAPADLVTPKQPDLRN